jgi:hypothetical protein
MSMPLNKKIIAMLWEVGIYSEFVPCALQHPIVDNKWTVRLPNISQAQWNTEHFRLVIHAQDFCHWHDGVCLELQAIEKMLTLDQQHKTIFLHWDHCLVDFYQGPIHCVEFPTHSWELVNELKDRWVDWKAVHNKSIKYNFLCLNGYSRAHRNQVYSLLADNSKGFTTHSTHNPAPMALYSKYDFDNVGNFIKLMPLYQQSKSSIVTESIYADHPGIITEKTLLAIAAKHPFMCIGHRGIHQEITKRGFANYNELFDLSYDTLDMDQRLHAAIDLNIELLSNNNFDIESVTDKINCNFDFLMNDYVSNVEQQCLLQLKNY